MKFFRIITNDGKNNFSESSIEIENNIGPLSGTRTTIVGDYNGDTIPDVFFVSHDGHEGPLGSHPGGFPSILLSQGEKFVYRDINLKRCWYNDASSADIDLDGDLDIVYGGGCHGLLINDGYGNFTNVEKFINNYNPGQNEGGAGVISLIDMNNDKYPDLLFRTYWYSYLVFSENGISLLFRNSDILVSVDNVVFLLTSNCITASLVIISYCIFFENGICFLLTLCA